MLMKNIKTYILFCIILALIHIDASIYASGESEARTDFPHLFATQKQLENRISEVSENFAFILPNGKIHQTFHEKEKSLYQTFSPDMQHLSTSDFKTKAFTIIKIDREQIPHIKIDGNTQWRLSNKLKNEKKINGEDFSALGFKTREVKYYRYDGSNPLFTPNSSYNTMSYISVDGAEKPVLERFLFYRWTGVNMGVDLETYMFAIDTYTGLVFTYVKIGAWKSAFGVQIPTNYDPIDYYKTQDGSPRFFFEYDPVGFVSKEGDIILYDWYIERTKENLKEQLLSYAPLGKSPYYIP